MECLGYVLLSLLAFTAHCNVYENKLTKLWSMSSASPEQRTVVNVQSEYVVEPESATSDVQQGRVVYFKPRAIPLEEQDSQVERTARYGEIRDSNQYKKEILFPGSYFPIADAKKENDTFDPLEKYPFRPKSIPLLRRGEYGGQGRSLRGDESQVQPTAMRRSYVYFDDDGEDYEDEEKDIDEEGDEKKAAKKKGPKIKKKYMKYMLPLLLAYKLKFFTLIPLLMGGMVLLTGATGMAGFFFALFAAVMGLSKSTGH